MQAMNTVATQMMSGNPDQGALLQAQMQLMNNPQMQQAVMQMMQVTLTLTLSLALTLTLTLTLSAKR